VEHAQHSTVLGECVGDESREALAAGAYGQVLQQQRRNAVPLPCVVDDKRDFDVARVGDRVVTGDADDLVAGGGHERFPVLVVHRGEVLDFGRRQTRMGAEEPEVRGVERQTPVKAQEPIGVFRLDWTYLYDGAVGEQRVARGSELDRGHRNQTILHRRVDNQGRTSRMTLTFATVSRLPIG
jgi:hypothetical protein